MGEGNSAPAAVFPAIGNPGRAALEVPDGPPPAVVGPADIELSAASLPGIGIRAASVRGVQHRSRHTVRQDAFALGQFADTVAVAAVCDGVGSLDRSDYAAALASRHLARHGIAGTPWPDAFAAVNTELTKAAAEFEATSSGAMATTALAVSVSWSNGWWLGEAAWVGDSPLWHLGDDGGWRPITLDIGADGQGYHSSGVRPLPTADGSCSWCSFRCPGGALFAMTDGVSNPLAWSSDVQATLASWWARPPDPLTFAAQVGFARKTHIDDRTVVGIWPDGE
jgi:Protein phosphatase 2C